MFYVGAIVIALALFAIHPAFLAGALGVILIVWAFSRDMEKRRAKDAKRQDEAEMQQWRDLYSRPGRRLDGR